MAKGKKRGSVLLKNMFILFLSLTAAALVLILVAELRKPKNEPVCEYVSMSEEAAARAYIWLSQMEDMPFSYAEIKEMMGDIELTLVLTPAGEKGKYMRSPDEASFADCAERAGSGFERAYRETLRHRFRAAGCEDELTDAMLDDMMREAYGVSVAEYLTGCEVQLIPTLDELADLYYGEVTHE